MKRREVEVVLWVDSLMYLDFVPAVARSAAHYAAGDETSSTRRQHNAAKGW